MRHEYRQAGWVMFAVTGVLGLAAGASPTATLVSAVAVAVVAAVGVRLAWGSSTDNDDERAISSRSEAHQNLVTEDDSKRNRKWPLTGGLLVLMVLTQVASRIPDAAGLIGRFVPVLWSACGLLGVIIITLHVLDWRSSKRCRGQIGAPPVE